MSECAELLGTFLQETFEDSPVMASQLGVETSSLCSLRLCEPPSFQRERDDPLLCPVVEVPLDAAKRLVCGADDPHARSFQLRPRLHVRNRGFDQRGEVRETRLGIRC